MPDIECFWVERTDHAQRSLRRWISTTGVDATIVPHCADPGSWYHSASVYIGDAPLELHDEAIAAVDITPYIADPRWPNVCERCGWAMPTITRWDTVSRFDGSVNLQVNQEPIYRRASDGSEWPMQGLPAGAMFDCYWHHDHWVGVDGISLMIVTPYSGNDNRAAMWIPDGMANNAPGVIPAWQRVGDPRNPPSLTITPSIQTGTYHGWLRAGKLVDA